MTPLEKLKALSAAKKLAEAAEVKKDESVKEQSTPEVVHEAVPELPPEQVPDVLGQEVSVSNRSSGSVHPLVMELAELEEALNKNIPDFRVQLRNIHTKLRQDPAIVTAMTDEEIGIVVKGLITHANAEIVAPKAVKAAKSAAKKIVSADDL